MFTKNNIGDAVRDGDLKGAIIDFTEDYSFPVMVRFDNGGKATYTADGRFVSGSAVTLELIPKHDFHDVVIWLANIGATVSPDYIEVNGLLYWLDSDSDMGKLHSMYLSQEEKR